MASLARKYMKEEFEFSYEGSLFSMKPILKSSEIDDSRPTVIRVHNRQPVFVSVLSGKINTVYDLSLIHICQIKARYLWHKSTIRSTALIPRMFA